MITAGASLSLSGRYALQGRQALAGLEAWVAEVNEGGGLSVPGSAAPALIRLVCYDDLSQRQAVTANVLRLLDEDRVDVLFGPYASDLTRTAARLTGPRGRMLWNHGGSSDEIGGPASRVVSVPTPASLYYAGTLKVLHARHPHAGRLAYLYSKRSQFGRQILGGIAAIATGLGFTVIPVPYTSMPGDGEAVLTALHGQACDLVLSGGAFADEVALTRAVRASGRKYAALACVGAALQEFGELLGEDAEQVYAPSQWERGLARPVDCGPDEDKVVASIERAGTVADYVAAQAYAAGIIAQQCLQTATEDSDATLWEAARKLDCTTFFGRFRLDASDGRQIVHEMVTVQWQNGRKRVIS